jgi:hypothetical protein
MPEQPDVYGFADSEAGLTHMLHLTLSLRRLGFKTQGGVVHVGPTMYHTLAATRPARAPRGIRLAGFMNAR